MAYTLTGEKCGTVRIDPEGTVVSEGKAHTSKVTSNPVEDGSDINDHVVLNPEQITISGVTADGVEAASRLEEMWRTRDILRYEGRLRIDSAVITSLTTNTSPGNADGVAFKVTLQTVTFTSAMYVPMGTTPLMSQQDAGASVSSGAAKSSGSTTNAGRKTTSTEYISQDAYVSDYVNSYSRKPAASAGPTTRSTQSYSGLEGAAS